MLNVIDEFTRECLTIRVEHSIGAEMVVAVLERLAVERGRAPAFVRFDNGPEFVAYAVADWCALNGTDTVFIDPGSPWQNAWIESFNGKLRDELLNLWRLGPWPATARRGSADRRFVLLTLLRRSLTVTPAVGKALAGTKGETRECIHRIV